MKKNLKVLALAILCIGVISACSKKSSSSSSSPYTMTATKGGTPVTVSGQSAVYAIVSGPILEVIGENISGSDTTGFVLMVGNYTGVGSYTIDGITNAAEYVSKTGSSGTLVLGTSGTITVTSATSPQMKGTFSFSDGTTSITGGSFTAHF